MPKSLGLHVVLRLKNGAVETFRNVTEIHYNYEGVRSSAKGLVPGSGRVAFESDIHSTGILREIEDIQEFEATLETERAKEF